MSVPTWTEFIPKICIKCPGCTNANREMCYYGLPFSYLSHLYLQYIGMLIQVSNRQIGHIENQSYRYSSSRPASERDNSKSPGEGCGSA